MTAKSHIGTSGYSYKGWHERFYPEYLAQKDLLPFYAERFNAVEINNSFYKVPTQRAVAHWIGQTPKGFKFCFKLSRFLTHMKRLKDSHEPVERFFEAVEGAGGHQGPLLLQLSPQMKPEFGRLEETLSNIRQRASGARWQVAVEVRQPDWYGEELSRVLKRHRAALVLHDMPDSYIMEEPDTARFLYMRFHGPRGDYGSEYPLPRLKKAAAILNRALKDGKNVYAFFNNDRDGYAVEDAARLRDMLIA